MSGVEFFQRALFFLWCLISIISLVQTLDEYTTALSSEQNKATNGKEPA